MGCRLLLVGVAVLAVSAPVAGRGNAAAPLRLPTATSTVTVSQGGRSFAARLVRPAKAGTYPVIAFGHGFAQSPSRYASMLTAMASRGYIVIAPNSEAGLFPSHGRLAEDLWISLSWARKNVRGASATRDAVGGHSMGGGAALVAADRRPAIDAVLTLAAAETTPSSTTAAAGIGAPALFVVGTQDDIVAPATTRAMFTAKPPPATFASIIGGYHCGFNDSTSFLGLGCDSGSIGRSR
jgi:dienelactone hydrolase